MLDKYTKKRYEGTPSDDAFIEWMLGQEAPEIPESDVDKAWSKMQAKIQKPVRKISWVGTSMRIAAGIALLCVIGFIGYNQLTSPEMIRMVAENAPLNVELPDGSNVTIAPGSAISYLEKFEEQRDINLEGEAYFDVVKNEIPFLIEVGEMNVRVLGTAFNVLETEQEVRVFVDRGLVAMEKGDQQFKIAPNQEGIYLKKKNRLLIDKQPGANATSWKTGVFEFDNTPLFEAVASLQKYYDVDFKLGNNFKTCRITARFNNAELKEVISVLENILNADITYSDTEVRIKGKGCQ